MRSSCLLCSWLALVLACGDERGGADASGEHESDTESDDGEPGDGDGEPGDGDGEPGDGDGEPDDGDGEPGDGDGEPGDGDGEPGNGDGDELDPFECDTPDPAWIFCDDFESDEALVGEGRWFEHADDDGEFALTEGAGLGASRGMRAYFEAGEVDAGSLKLSFGRNPNAYMNKSIRPNEDFREIWYRMYLRHQDGWVGDPAKLSRATSFTSASDWSQAMIAHLWGDGEERLLVDPVSCVDDGQVLCQGYNDFANMKWLGSQSGQSEIFSTAWSDQWFCIEAHVKLNDPGMQNGVQEFWIDGQLQARREGLDFVGTWTEYGINAVFFENYWNDGSVQDQTRDFDNIVISTAPIGCL